MIYMVDHVYTDAATEQAWNDWYAANINLLLTVPGVYGVQRFKAIGQQPSRYLSMYSVESGGIFESPEYKRVQGGGTQSIQFHKSYLGWTRNLFDGAARAPELTKDQRVFVCDSNTPDKKFPGSITPLWLKATPGLPKTTPFSAQKLATTPYRALIVLDSETPVSDFADTGGYVYEPITEVSRPQ